VRVADTSALYALFNEGDRHHARASAAMESPEPIVVPREILTETIDLIGYRKGWPHARKALASLLALPHVRPAEPVNLDAVVAVYEAGGGDLSLADAVVVQTCRVLAAEPLTFDADIVAALKA